MDSFVGWGSFLGRAHSTLARRACLLVVCGATLLPLRADAHQTPAKAERPPIEEVLRQLREKYKDGEKKYAALATKVDKAVRKALANTPDPGRPPESPRSLAAHPYLTLVDELSAAVRVKPSKAVPASSEIVARYPWSERLDLVEGLQYGSNRPVPAHENGFIELGLLPDPGPALPGPCVNEYLFGLHEIVGWRAYVTEGKKQPAFRGRTPKDPTPSIETELPPWEALRVYLRGSLPEVSLFAIPRLTHLLHARLAERRRTADKAAPMDELLALLDAHWNGFTFESPYAKTPTAVALPVFSLIANRKGFVYRFPVGEHLATTGDIPFVSDLAMRSYALALRGESLEMRDFIAQTPPAVAARDAFWRDCAYLSGYRALVDLFVRSILEPGSPLPAYLEGCDFSGTSTPERAQGAEFDVPRKYALVLWARAGKDPAALADLLYDQVLDLELNRFPKRVSLQTELAYLLRKRDDQLLTEIRGRVFQEHRAGEAPGDLEREFSPRAQYLEPSSEASTDFLVHSYQTFHTLVRDVIRDAAYDVVLAEVDGK